MKKSAYIDSIIMVCLWYWFCVVTPPLRNQDEHKKKKEIRRQLTIPMMERIKPHAV